MSGRFHIFAPFGHSRRNDTFPQTPELHAPSTNVKQEGELYSKLFAFYNDDKSYCSYLFRRSDPA